MVLTNSVQLKVLQVRTDMLPLPHPRPFSFRQGESTIVICALIETAEELVV